MIEEHSGLAWRHENPEQLGNKRVMLWLGHESFYWGREATRDKTGKDLVFLLRGVQLMMLSAVRSSKGAE